MNQRHYFTNNDDLKSKRKELSFRFLSSIDLKFISDYGVFSKEGIDYGSRLLLETIVKEERPQSVLDVGAGYGLIGITLSKYWNIQCDMCEINQRAVLLSKLNIDKNNVAATIIESNLFEKIDHTYDLIVTNPPIRAGKKVIYQLFEDAAHHLNSNGSMWLVIRKNHGAESAIKFLENYYAEVKLIKKSKGFWIIKAIKK